MKKYYVVEKKERNKDGDVLTRVFMTPEKKHKVLFIIWD